MAYDPVPGWLFVASAEHGTIEVVSPRPSPDDRISLTYPGRPLGAVYVSAIDSVVITDGERDRLWMLETPWCLFDQVPNSMAVRSVGPNPDNIRYLPTSGQLLIGLGSGVLGLMAIREQDLRLSIELGGQPESFQVDVAEKRCWVNVPDKQAIGVVDLEAKKVARWIDVKSAKQNYPMALAEREKRLLVGCRDPGKLLVFDIETDALMDELPLSGDVDDIFVDEARGLLYASCGEGFVDVFERSLPGAWKPKEKVKTSPGARTCLFVPSVKKLFVAVPHRGEQQAEIRVFSTAP